MQQTLHRKLTEAFAPTVLEIVNESHKHAGHASSPGTGESHFRVKIVSEAFRGKTRVACHRMVNTVLAEELAGGIHALALTTSAPPSR